MYPPAMLEQRLLTLAAVVAVLSASGCKDEGKASEASAVRELPSVSHLVDEDVQELARGLPVGAKQLRSLYEKGGDPAKDLTALRTGLRRIRGEVPDLTKSKATFFALADAHGIAIRNDLEQDVMAGQNVWSLFPALAKVETAGFVTSTGLFAGARGPEADRDWVAAAPVTDDKGAFEGALLAGWTMRRFANHLQESTRHDLIDELAKAKNPGKLPIVYVMVFDRSGVFSAPLTPSVNEKAILDLNLVDKTQAGMTHGVLSITERDFGYAAVRMPSLEADGGIAILWSEI
jgi:hypothetical protein